MKKAEIINLRIMMMIALVTELTTSAAMKLNLADFAKWAAPGSAVKVDASRIAATINPGCNHNYVASVKKFLGNGESFTYSEALKKLNAESFRSPRDFGEALRTKVNELVTKDADDLKKATEGAQQRILDVQNALLNTIPETHRKSIEDLIKAANEALGSAETAERAGEIGKEGEKKIKDAIEKIRKDDIEEKLRRLSAQGDTIKWNNPAIKSAIDAFVEATNDPKSNADKEFGAANAALTAIKNDWKQRQEQSTTLAASATTLADRIAACKVDQSFTGRLQQLRDRLPGDVDALKTELMDAESDADNTKEKTRRILGGYEAAILRILDENTELLRQRSDASVAVAAQALQSKEEALASLGPNAVLTSADLLADPMYECFTAIDIGQEAYQAGTRATANGITVKCYFTGLPDADSFFFTPAGAKATLPKLCKKLIKQQQETDGAAAKVYVVQRGRTFDLSIEGRTLAKPQLIDVARVIGNAKLETCPQLTCAFREAEDDPENPSTPLPRGMRPLVAFDDDTLGDGTTKRLPDFYWDGTKWNNPIYGDGHTVSEATSYLKTQDLRNKTDDEISAFLAAWTDTPAAQTQQMTNVVLHYLKAEHVALVLPYVDPSLFAPLGDDKRKKTWDEFETRLSGLPQDQQSETSVRLCLGWLHNNGAKTVRLTPSLVRIIAPYIPEHCFTEDEYSGWKLNRETALAAFRSLNEALAKTKDGADTARAERGAQVTRLLRRLEKDKVPLGPIVNGMTEGE
ncbi:MAG: hypothetical protein LBS14_01605 [Holosporaceae bacterium]|jgi:hypothetical protein|nr:hypothetical protein [Holosporaceae bacterium]